MDSRNSLSDDSYDSSGSIEAVLSDSTSSVAGLPLKRRATVTREILKATMMLHL